ncbi:type VI secretion system-associated FHA domain protein TagH [Pseudoduganella albidiflava]|uniref:Type VI secretion system-associated FHA domain protein TagH n=1 Tax=Pseudoduganella albidiflava TaxID=321983 RepID=A0A411WWW5_9BURK|nr:type VI secretion system-associated FHA domain protein TagH [Pseudoduganella albidiflava]QBI01293.1 type VI secretion system-associated FHA domain protein TagH [Pseudoduganella albidiflava]GGY36820.1 hypothetical protein GCM10007387_18950 [Pseudoduganella albidiflava]
MLTIKAVSYNGQATDVPLAGEFGELGGVIGRADGNALVLPDPDRYVSRMHAMVLFRNGRHVIRDLSNASPVFVNDRPLGHGNEATLADGDELRIGGYTLAVADARVSPVVPPAAPHAGLAPKSPAVLPAAPPAGSPVLSPVMSPSLPPNLPAGPPSAMPAMRVMEPRPAGVPKDDPLGLFDSPASPPSGGFSPAPPSGGFAHAPGAGGIPDDFSFSELVPRAPAPDPRQPLPDDFDLGLGQAARTDINQFYDLGPAAGSELFPDGHPLAPGGANGSGAASVDPLVAIGAVPAPKPAPASQRDDAPEIRSAFTPPAAQRIEPVQPAGPADGGNMVVSWNAPDELPGGDGIKTMIVQSPARKARAPETETSSTGPAPALAPEPPALAAGPAATAQPSGGARAAVPAQPLAHPQPIVHPRADPHPHAAPNLQQAPHPQAGQGVPPADAMPPGPAMRPAPAVPPSAAVPSEYVAQPAAGAQPAGDAQADSAELLRAFLAGAGVPDLDVRGPLTPQMMHTFGQLLREATQGTLDLLLSRAVIKREIHAEMTMIVTRENNPLKFSPNVEVALTHLLAPRGQGFMPPLVAMKDAHDDLRAHQFAFMAGMRAALAGVLQRFDPAQLERRLSGKSLVDTLLPANRKAKLWDLYAEMYSELTREAEDDFHAWFGKAFLNAYEAQLDKLARGDEGGR